MLFLRRGANAAEDLGQQFVEVRNDSCGDYWLRVVLSDPVGDGVELLPPGSGAAGAGGGGGLARQGFFAPARVDAARSSR